ncbi:MULTISPECIES: enoyl-CoA hydratase/isomerase family protein [unclassified Nocardioides]|uniref:enoyl-CoA hydratase/isomerase family protein n=1 Tax=unclassified Nocardioides TaxID=2615069 RepID=UPI0006F72DD3|nr:MULTISPECIES: enoyl-CoA hydratase/isomerase family protein [unclassified Nocardioides]KRA28062.1 enoyl-CoA hydratase [Nocardioides sp. Root614]KRA86037.1 enoyl-CoA hydratase [Nocardioides sp. Root682]
MSQVLFEMSDDVAIVTTSNPPAELFDAGQIAGLRAAIRGATEQRARAMLIKSDARLFSGGADVATVFHRRSRQEGRDLLADGMEVIAELEDAPFPVIAAVNGLCFAAGLEVALACDFIYAADDAVFSQVEALIGVTTLLGGVYRLAERCGPAIAREIVYTADQYTADQFAQWHIVNRVVPAADLHQVALDVAQKIARGPALAHLQTKRLVRHALAHDARAADRLVLDEATSVYDTEDMHNAVGYLVEHGARKFRANHHLIAFEGR